MRHKLLPIYMHVHKYTLKKAVFYSEITYFLLDKVSASLQELAHL